MVYSLSMKTDILTNKKERIDGHRPLSEALVKNLDDWFHVELTYTSNALEGNTLTRKETSLVIEKGLTVGGKSLVEHLEATNHAAALNWVKQQVARTPAQLTENDILKIHTCILRGIEDEHAGHYRSIPVRISGSAVVLPNAQKVPVLMERFIHWLHEPSDLHPVIFAAEAHYQLVTIHPFVDGNGRTARLLMNLLLMMRGYPLAIIHPRERLDYISSLEKAQLGGDKKDFLQLITKSVDRSLDIYLKAIAGESSEVEKDEGTGLLKIGELASQANESNSTIRHWTKIGLLEVSEISLSGYQLYHPDMLERIKQIHNLKKKRYTLQEIMDRLI